MYNISKSEKMKALLALQLATLSLAKLVVYSPKELVDQFNNQGGVIQSNYANFGHIPYG
jgi:hypothetical protein